MVQMKSVVANSGDSSPLKLLSFDGGGIRGLSSLIILQHLMRRINPEKPPKPCDYFDMIGGTSTGGLIAIMLGRLRMSVEECIEKYLNLSSTAFQLKRSKTNVLGRAKTLWKGEGAYQGDALATEFRKAAYTYEGDEDAKLLCQDDTCRVFVCSFGKSLNRPVRFRSYPTLHDGASSTDCTIWEAARATSAAATFFDPLIINQQAYVDGATGLNNPVEVLLEEARAVWPDALARIQCIVSIGTGVPELRDFGDDIKHILQTLKSIATETEQTHMRFLRYHEDLGLKGRYFRFNVAHGLAAVRLDDHTKISTIEAAAEAYMSSAQAQTEAIRFAIAEPPNPGYIKSGHKDHCLEWLSCIDQQKFFNESSLQRNTDTSGHWFLKGHFEAWQLTQKSLLWLNGKAGTGKTILTSTIIDEIAIRDTTLLAYYYFSFQTKESQDLRQFKCALLVQLVKAISESHAERPGFVFIPTSFRSLRKKHFPSRSPPMDELDSTIVDVINEAQKTSIVIDALDECESTILRASVLDFLSWVLQSASAEVHILVTSRPEADIEKKISLLPIDTESVSLDPHLVDLDIEDHILALMKQSSYNQWSGDLQREVISHITGRANGNFRWADLQIQALNGKSREVDVRRALKRLPRNLGETYERMLQRICFNDYQFEALAVLRWLTVQKRPMKLVEIGELAAFEAPGDAGLSPSSGEYFLSFIPQNRFSNLSELVQILSGLITVFSPTADAKSLRIPSSLPRKPEIEDLFVEFSHFSVFEYLLSGLVTPPLFQLQFDECRWFCVKSCLTYINGYDSDSSPTFKVGGYPLLSYACFRLWEYIEDLSSLQEGQPAALTAFMDSHKHKAGYALKLALEPTRQSNTFSKDISDFIKHFPRRDEGESIVDAFRLGDPNLLALMLRSGVEVPRDILTKLVKTPERMRSRKPTDANESSKHPDIETTTKSTASDWSIDVTMRPGTCNPATSNFEIMWKMLLDHADVDINATNSYGQTPLLLAALCANEEFFDLLVVQKSVDCARVDQHNWDPLTCAIIGGHKDILQSVVARGMYDFSRVDRYGWSALDWANYKGVDKLISPALDTLPFRPQASQPSQISFDLTGQIDACDGVDEVWFICFSHDCERIVACLSTGEVSIFSTQTLDCLLTLKDHIGGATCAAWSPADCMIVTCSQDRYAMLWNTETGILLRVFERFQEPVTGCVWLPDGNSFFLSSLDRDRALTRISLEMSGSAQGTTISHSEKSYSTSAFGNVKTGLQSPLYLGLPSARIEGMDITADGHRIIAFSDSRELVMFSTKKEKFHWKQTTETRITSVSVSQDSELILLNLADGGIELRDLNDGKLIRVHIGAISTNYLLRSSFGGVKDSFIIKPEDDGYISIWSTNSGTLVGHAEGHHPIRVNCVSWRCGHPYSFASGGDDGKVKLWSCENTISQDHEYRKLIGGLTSDTQAYDALE